MKKSRWDSEDEAEHEVKKKRAPPSKGSKLQLETSKDSSVKPVHDEKLPTALCTASVGIRVHIPLFHGCRSVNEYQRLNFISQGTYGYVFRAKCIKTGELFALKQIKIGVEANKGGFPISALRESNILLALQHPNIVRVKEMVVGSSIDKIFMVMEYADNDLRYCMEKAKTPFSIGEVKQLMVQFLSAMEHMHNNWYIHRDLKTANLLYSNKGKLTVCDFGMARKYGSPIGAYSQEVVTLYYRAPEVLLGAGTYSTPLDMWSVGCIYAEMLTGKYLCPGEGELDQVHKICRLLGTPAEDKWPGITTLPNASRISWKAPSRGNLRQLFSTNTYAGLPFLNDTGFDLLTMLLQWNPAHRIDAHNALNHPWLKSEEPHPTPCDMMPTFKSRHEQQESRNVET